MAPGAGAALKDELLAQLATLQAEVQARFPQAAALSVADLLRWPGMVEDAAASQDMLQAEVGAAAAETLDAFVGSRRREGAALEAMLLARIADMERIVVEITPIVPQVVAQVPHTAPERMG